MSYLICVSVCVLAESEEIQELLSDHGITVQTMSEVLPIRVMPARILSHVYVRLGKTAHLAIMFVCICTINRRETSMCPSHRKLQETEFEREALQTHWSSGNIQIL